MRRRGNKSSKVPNVKLRPAQAGSSLRANPESFTSTCWAEDSQLGSDDTSIADLCPRPFKGVVVCATGILDKPTLFKQALELGATSMSAFTDRVTHLVAVDHGGAKYTCALERKIPILQPSWITESYQIWLRGDDVDLSDMAEKHRLPVFSGVVLSPSGILDITRRTQINKLLTKEQGVYVKNLERPVRVTHLLCSGDDETDKMRYAEKFNSRGEAKIHLVWEEWFWDSLEFGGRFDEEKYQVRHPRPERKALPEPPASSPPPSSAPPPEEELPTTTKPTHKQPETQDEGEEEMASVKRLPAVTLQLWESLLKPRGYEINAGALSRSPSKASQAQEARVPARPPSPANIQEKGAGSVISSFRRANSFAPALKAVPAPEPKQPFRRNLAVGSVAKPLEAGEAGSGSAAGNVAFEGPPENQAESSSAGAGPPGPTTLFVGVTFRALGEARSASVRLAIEGCGGRLVSEEGADENVDYVLVRLVSGSKLFRDEGDEAERIKYRTECWLERCIFEERICPADDHVSFTPLRIETPVPGAEDINLSFSGLDQSEACCIRRLLRALGANLAPNFSRRSTHLLCPSAIGAKFDKAREWRIPVINTTWLAEMAKTGVVPSVSAHLVLAEGESSIPGMVGDPAIESKVDVKGKGKAINRGNGRAKELDSRMNDITNKGDSENQPDDPIVPQQNVDLFKPRKSPLKQPHAPPQECSFFGNPNSTLGGHPPPPHRPSPTKAKSQEPQNPGIDPWNTPVKPPRIDTIFGNPPGALGHPSPSRRALPTDTPPRSHSTGLEYITHPNSAAPSPRRSAGTYASPVRRLTLCEVERDRKQTRIPSSRTPSPMKAPPSRPPSPEKITNEVTKALQESITSLLGKRQPSDEDDPARVGKRARPHRSKTQSRQHSDAQVSEISAAPVSTYDGSPFEAYDELNLVDGDGRSVEESMRVMYEDPGQRDEKRRLMSLFESQTEEGKAAAAAVVKEEGRKRRGLVRRSTRIAGF